MSGVAWSAVSALAAVGALIAVITFGVLNLRRAAKGPLGTPAFALTPTSETAWEIKNVGTADARDAALEFGDPAPTRVDGQLTWDLFSREGGSTIWPLFGDDVHQAQCRVVMTWTPCHRYDTGRWEGAFSGRLL